jgi:tRNA(Arg) A34 adenosine deaminase TadA
MSDQPEYRLFSSCAPCVHCFGVIYWSGLKQIYSAASKEDAESAGFDEGPLTQEMWDSANTKKGIYYYPDFCGGESARRPFQVFAALQGTLY